MLSGVPDNPGSKTLEYTTAEFAKAQMAKMLYDRASSASDKNKYKAPFNKYVQRAGRWREVIAKNRPSGSQTAARNFFAFRSNFYEGTPQQYRWVVPYDGAPLFKRGLYSPGKTPLQILETHAAGFATATDSTSSMYMGNQVCLATPWLFNYAKVPNKTQSIVREVMEELYNDGINFGIPGNDDLGTLSGWYVSAALGIAPTIPGVPVFLLNTPYFNEVHIYRILKNIGDSGFSFSADNFAEGPTKIKANAADVNKFIKSATLKKKDEPSASAYNKSYIKAKDLRQGELQFVTTSTESEAMSWSRSDDSVPPSMSSEANDNEYNTVADKLGMIDHGYAW